MDRFRHRKSSIFCLRYQKAHLHTKTLHSMLLKVSKIFPSKGLAHSNSYFSQIAFLYILAISTTRNLPNSVTTVKVLLYTSMPIIWNMMIKYNACVHFVPNKIPKLHNYLEIKQYWRERDAIRGFTKLRHRIYERVKRHNIYNLNLIHNYSCCAIFYVFRGNILRRIFKVTMKIS